MVKSNQFEFVLQQEISTNKQWELMLENDGLTVVDVYSDWCGPCTAMKTTLRRAQHKLKQYTLNFAKARSDNIGYLQVFKGRSEPTWVFLAGRQIVNIMYGANGPKLTHLIIEEVKKEIAAKAGIRERANLELFGLPEEIEYDEEETSGLEELAVNASDMQLDSDYIYRPF